MAITTVRAKVFGEWKTLTYNAGTGYYELPVTPATSSSGQPGGYYDFEVEAANDTGNTIAVSGDSFKTLRLVVREAVPPSLVLVSPPQGIITTNAPNIALTATDNASGVNPAAVAMTIDGAAVTPTVTAISNGYSITYTPTLPEGAHQIIVTVEDYDKNRAALTLAYTVDTVHPALTLYTDGLRRVVDDETLTVSGRVKDATTGVSSVVISGGASPVTASLDAAGGFSEAVPLAVGVNDIVITATDAAGLESSQSFRAVRLITDRTQADVDAAAELIGRVQAGGWNALDATEKQLYYSGLRGAYSFADLNRVNSAEEVLKPLMTALGWH